MFEAFKIGVQISMASNAASVLGAMAGHLNGVNAQTGKLNKDLSEVESTLSRIKKLTVVGGALMAGGGFGLSVLKAPYEEAKKLAQAQANFQTLNLSALENSEVFAKATSMSHKILGTTITENVKLIHDLHTAFGDLHHAVGSADMFAKMSLVAGIANGGKSVDGLTNAAAKALEHRGGKVINDPTAFAAEADLMTKVMLATKMRVSPTDYLTASGTGKMAYQMYDKEYLYGNFAGMMAINGGARTGTAGMTAFSSLIGGHMDGKGKGFLSDLGLWQEGASKKRLGLMNEAMSGMTPEERRTAIASMGGQSVLSGGLSDSNAELYAHRPDVFISTVLVPAIKKRFGMDLTDEQMALMVAKNFNRNTGDFLGTQITMAQKLGKDTAIVNKTMGIGAALKLYNRSPEGAEKAASAAWENFLTVFGSVYLPTITRGLLKLAGVLDSLGKFVSEHSTLTKGFVYLFAIMSAAAVAGGAIMLMKGGLTALGLVIGTSGGATGVVGGILSLTKSLGKAGLIGATGIAVIEIGRLGLALYDLFNVKTREGVKLSADSEARLKDPVVQAQLRAMEAGENMPLPPGGMRSTGNSPHIAIGQKAPIQVTTEINLDSRPLATAVTQHQAKDLNRPATGGRNFDGSMSLRALGAH